jgi:hypothetical protein
MPDSLSGLSCSPVGSTIDLGQRGHPLPETRWPIFLLVGGVGGVGPRKLKP